MNIDKIVLNELLELLSENKASLFNEISAERTNHIHVVVENLYQEHNASAVLRTCDCYGINKMHVIENINKYKVNSDIALGAGKWVETESHTQGEQATLECIKTLRSKGIGNIQCVAIHGIFAGDSDQALYEAGLNQLVTTNTVRHSSNAIDITPQLIPPVISLLKSSGLRS